MGLVRKIKAGLVKISVNDFVGEDGNIFFDIDDGVMRLSDGATPGGIPLSSGGGEGGASTFRQLLDTPSSFSGHGGKYLKVNAQASAIEFVDETVFDGDYDSLTNTPTLFNPSNITSNLIPGTTELIDLGSTSKKFRDLYLSGNTIFLGTAEISRNSGGGIDLPSGSKVGGVAITSTTSYNDLTDLPTLFNGAYANLTGKSNIPTDVSDLTDTGLGTATSALSLGNTTGNGIQYATSFGGSSLTIGYLMKNSAGADKFDTSASAENTMAIKTAIPVGPLSATIGYYSDNTTNATNTTVGVSTSMSAGTGTLSVAYVSQDATTDVTQMSAKYATTFGSASVAIGYSSTDADGAANTSDITATLSQSVGTGASVFAEFVNRNGAAAGTDTSAVLLGSSFAF